MIECGMNKTLSNPLIAWMQSSSRKSLPRAYETLVQVRAQLGEDAWAQQSLPWQALEKPELLGLLLHQGLSFSRLDNHPDYTEHGPRGLALFLDAPLETYTHFDAAGIEELSEDAYSRIGKTAIDKGRVNSFRAVHKAHPTFIESAVRREPSIICIGVMGRYLQSPSKKNMEMLRVVDAMGARWEHLESQSQFITVKNRPVFEAVVRELCAERLAHAWCGSISSKRSRTRL